MRADRDGAEPGIGQLGDVPPGLGELRENGARVLGERGAVDRRGDPARPAVVELDAEDLLQVPQRAGQRGLGDPQVRGSADDAAMLGERVDQHQVAQLEPSV